MNCAWKELLSILPQSIRSKVDMLGREDLQEIRIRQGRPIELVTGKGNILLQQISTVEQMNFVVNTASHYSPWAATTMKEGYITAPGGHRIGVCGECIMKDGNMEGIRSITSLCIRVARDVQGIAPSVTVSEPSLLILGPPGSGKTTLLRDVVRRISDFANVSVVDEREEIFPPSTSFFPGPRTDVLTGCAKPLGVLQALKTMTPTWIAVDEITSQKDCEALLHAGWCGVKLLATAHAADKQDLHRREIYKPLAESGLFGTLLILQPDKTWRMERMKL